jgi:hypothetical protein
MSAQTLGDHPSNIRIVNRAKRQVFGIGMEVGTVTHNISETDEETNDVHVQFS